MQKKKGISLIVLVITIIVMIVLAGAIILSLNNAGIIGNANKAVKLTDDATVKELAQLAWGEAYASGVREVDGETGLRARVTEALTKNGIEIEKYLLNVTTKGVTIKLLTEAWIQDKEELKVIRGKEELEIGQIIKYESGVEGYDDEQGWRVLGADEDGNLLIMSATDVNSEFQLGSTNLKEAQTDWLRQGINKLNIECAPYGNGEGAISARSITIEDIDKITKYDKFTYISTQIYDYGNEVIYFFNRSITPDYIGSNTLTGKVESDHGEGFYWYDENGMHEVSVEELTLAENNGQELAKVTSTYYGYTGTSKLSETTEAYKMIFGTSGNYNLYWLANSYINVGKSYIGFGMRIVREGGVNGGRLWASNGNPINPKRGVRAVVVLKSNIPMTSLVSQ